MSPESLSPSVLRSLAAEAFDSFDVVLLARHGATDGVSLELARRRISTLLCDDGIDALPQLLELPDEQIDSLADWPTSPHFDANERATLELTEQFVIDVASTSGDQRTRCLGALGDQAFATVQSIYVLDQGLRVRAALRQLFGALDGAASVAPEAGPDAARPDLWSAIEEWMRAVARLRSLDPLTTELVRLRGARAHDCRLCRSRRSVSAMRDGADESVFDQIDDYERSDLSERHKLALRSVDAMLWHSTEWPGGLAGRVRDEFDDAQVVELVFDVARNAANKIAVVFGADQANVEVGIELFDIDEAGDLVGGGTAGD